MIAKADMISNKFQVDFSHCNNVGECHDKYNQNPKLVWIMVGIQVQANAVIGLRHALLEWSFKNQLLKPHLVWQHYTVGELNTGKKDLGSIMQIMS